MSDVKKIHALVTAMSQSCAERDASINEVRLVRAGRIDRVYPDHFADDMPRAITANTIDVAARDISEMIAPLPSLACASGNMATSVDAVRAGKKNKIGSYYWKHSKLAVQNVTFVDSVVSYGFGVYLAEVDVATRCPRIRYETPFGVYYFKDRWGDLVWLAKTTYANAGQLAAKFPESVFAADMHRKPGGFNQPVQVVTYYDRHQTLVYLPDHNCESLAEAPNPIDRVPAVVAERGDQEDHPRGQFDDSVWPQLARARMALYMLQAADKSINAPTILPRDVTELVTGPDAVMVADNPQSARRMSLDVPQDVFAVDGVLDRNVKEGARYPEIRSGGSSANIITGRGVDALMGTTETLVTTVQTSVKQALEDITSICFALDVALYGDTPKTITGTITGKPYHITYVPSRDIGDSFETTCTYGFAAGQTPAQAVVTLLQLLGGKLIGQDTVRRQLPFDIDPEEEQRAIDVEELESAAKQGLLALAQAFGPMQMQGQSPVPVLMALARTVELRQKGQPVHKALLEAFTEAQEAASAAERAPAGPGDEGELPPGVRENGLAQGVPYGQQGAPPGGMPAVSGLLAELRGNGEARMGASIIRKRAIGAG